VGFSLSALPQNRRREVGAGHASRSSGLLHVKESLTRVSMSSLKTGGGVTVGGACGTIAKVHQRQVEDGQVDATDCVGPCYLTFTIFNVLGLRGIVVI
jgi:hypothetical protein